MKRGQAVEGSPSAPADPAADQTGKAQFDIDVVIERIAEAVEPFPKAALFELAEEGFGSPFEQLVACMISIRTRDEVTLPTARRLFAIARTPAAVASLPVGQIDALIGSCTFHAGKAQQIHAIARHVEAEHDGALPCEAEALMALPGVGPKCANLVLGIACGQERIAVDIHVHRVTNRWGYVREPTPERTMEALSAVLPRQYWVEINRLLVPFGKHVCTGSLPRCSSCPLLSMCRQVGVTARR